MLNKSSHPFTKVATLLLAATLHGIPAAQAQTQLTTNQARSLYKNDTNKRYVSVHDPSVVYEPQSKRYYIFGTHHACAWTTNMRSWTMFNSPWATATSQNAPNNQAFTTPQVTTVKKDGQEVSLPKFNAMDWAARTDTKYNIDTNMWAPDVIWNPTMQKWCQYLSINGKAWHSSIILLTADKITGPYRYQAPVVISGFYDNAHSYKDTDLEIVIGTQKPLPQQHRPLRVLRRGRQVMDGLRLMERRHLDAGAGRDDGAARL